MPYCPECKDEFQDGVTTCPDCKVALVDKLPPEPEEHFRKEKIVLAATAPNEIEAQLWKGILEDAGIESMVRVPGSMNIYVSPMMLKHELWVLEDDLEKAKDILGDIHDAPLGDVPDDEGE